MNKGLIVLMLLIATTAHAGGYQQPAVINKTFNKYINETNIYNSQTDVTKVYEAKRRMEVGVGADIILWEEDADIRDSVLFRSVSAQGRRDWNNGESSIYLVAEANAPKPVKSFFGKIFGGINRLFKRDLEE